MHLLRFFSDQDESKNDAGSLDDDLLDADDRFSIVQEYFDEKEPELREDIKRMMDDDQLQELERRQRLIRKVKKSTKPSSKAEQMQARLKNTENTAGKLTVNFKCEMFRMLSQSLKVKIIG